MGWLSCIMGWASDGRDERRRALIAVDARLEELLAFRALNHGLGAWPS
jgi:hypothetical protein